MKIGNHECRIKRESEYIIIYEKINPPERIPGKPIEPGIFIFRKHNREEI